jgi:hypothetical protein
MLAVSTGPWPSHRSRVIPTAGSLPRMTTVTGPGRITRAEIRYSHASRNNSRGESCSNARADRN